MWHLNHRKEPKVGPYRCSFLIAEAGASPLTIPPADDFSDTVVISQGSDQPIGELVARVVARLRALERGERAVSCVSYQVGTKHDSTTASARRSLVRVLGDHAQKMAITCIISLEAPNAPADARHALLAVAEELAAPPHRQLTLRFLFESPCSAPRSNARLARATREPFARARAGRKFADKTHVRQDARDP